MVGALGLYADEAYLFLLGEYHMDCPPPNNLTEKGDAKITHVFRLCLHVCYFCTPHTDPAPSRDGDGARPTR